MMSTPEQARKNLASFASMMKESGIRRPEDLYRHLLQEFDGTPYVWGGDTTEGSDCSGSVCASLSAAYKKHIRITADALYRRCFTKIPCSERGIQALFFLDRTGRAVHVAGYMGNGVYMNVSSHECNQCGTARHSDELKVMYPHLIPVRRQLDEQAVI